MPTACRCNAGHGQAGKDEGPHDQGRTGNSGHHLFLLTSAWPSRSPGKQTSLHLYRLLRPCNLSFLVLPLRTSSANLPGKPDRAPLEAHHDPPCALLGRRGDLEPPRGPGPHGELPASDRPRCPARACGTSFMPLRQADAHRLDVLGVADGARATTVRRPRRPAALRSDAVAPGPQPSTAMRGLDAVSAPLCAENVTSGCHRAVLGPGEAQVELRLEHSLVAAVEVQREAARPAGPARR